MTAARVPPHDLDAEAAVLSAVLLSSEAFDEVSDVLRSDHFYSDANRLVFRAACDLRASQNQVDAVRVATRLRDQNRLEQIGGTPYLARLTDAIPAVAHAVDHARVVREKWRARQLIAQCQRFVVEAFSGSDIGQVLSDAREALAEIEGSGREARPVSPAEIVERWQQEGPLVRVPTGIDALDRACRGGLPIPWRVFIVGAPGAGKTFVEIDVANRLAQTAASAGLCVGILAVDEEPEDITIRIAQIHGFTVREAEEREGFAIRAMRERLAPLRIRLYGPSYTIESAAADLAHWAAREERRGALFVDSIQAARSRASLSADTPRAIVEANVTAIRRVSTTHRLLVVATSEANRASYRTNDAMEATNDMAAGAESRAIEFGAQTQLMLRTPKDHPDVIHARITKNRRGYLGEFWLRLDRERHALTECPDPSADPGAAERAEAERRSATIDDVQRDAGTLLQIVFARGRDYAVGMGERDLRSEIKAAGHKWGRERLDAAKVTAMRGVSGSRLVNRGPHGRDSRWHVEPLDEHGRAADA